MQEEKTDRRENQPQSWAPAVPEELPELTFWPIVLALGTVFIFWGLITSLIISGVGVAIGGTAIYGWVEEFSDE